jgi:hypothetical protein
MNTNSLLAGYRIHVEEQVMVDVEQLTDWVYLRNPHKNVIKEIADNILVS